MQIIPISENFILSNTIDNCDYFNDPDKGKDQEDITVNEAASKRNL